MQGRLVSSGNTNRPPRVPLLSGRKDALVHRHVSAPGVEEGRTWDECPLRASMIGGATHWERAGFDQPSTYPPEKAVRVRDSSGRVGGV